MAEGPVAAPDVHTARPHSQGRLVLRRFLGHRLAVGALAVLGVMVVVSFAGGELWRWQVGELSTDYSHPPSWSHPFGTNEIGADTLAAVLRGAQRSLQVAVAVAVVSTLVGSLVGAVAGWYRGWVDAVLMRLTDLFLVVPALAVLLVLAARFGQSSLALALVIAGLVWMPLARVVRGEVLSLRERQFVEAARALGASGPRVIARHLLPNAVGPVIVNATLTVAVAILLETALSFLGFGIQPPDVSLGKLVADGANAARTRWWLFYLPGAYLIVILLCVNFVGDGLRDAFDPEQRPGRR